MKKTSRLVLALILFVIVVVLYVFFLRNVLVNKEIQIIIISASLLMLVFSFVIEVFFTKPVEVLATSISILLLLYPQKDMLYAVEKSLPSYVLTIYLLYCFVVCIMALISQLLLTKEKSPQHNQNRFSKFLKDTVEFIASSKIMYFSLGIMMITLYIFDYKTIYLLYLAYFFLVLLLAINQSKLQNTIDKIRNSKNKKKPESIGYIIGTESNDIFKAQLHDSTNISLFEDVIFRTHLKSKPISSGVVIKTQILNDCERFDILKVDDVEDENLSLEKGEIQKVHTNSEDKIIGLVCQNTNVTQLYFKYIPETKIEVGDVLRVKIHDKNILYQVINGKVNVESLNNLDCDGYIVGEAIQLGYWDEQKQCFEMFGWIPEYNTIIYKSEHETITELDEDISIIGAVPNTQYKIAYDYTEGINHHLAILGVTGSGKSVFARQLIKNVTANDIKVIAIDFTNEYIKRFENIKVFFSENNQDYAIAQHINAYRDEMDKWPRDRSKSSIRSAIQSIESIIHSNIQDLLNDEEIDIGLVEYPEMSNSVKSISFLEFFFKFLFEYIKNSGYEKKICIVLEEAHTIVPEWNSISGGDKSITSQMVNTINQIALQGRKHGIGFIVIAQRTANVSKTILSQCNSIIAFQQFDNTSKEFLSNHFSPEMTQALPSLKPRHAIVAGKGFSSTLPVIIRVPDIDNEPEFEHDEAGEQEVVVEQVTAEAEDFDPPF